MVELPDRCEIHRLVCDMCSAEHPEWEAGIERAMAAFDPQWPIRKNWHGSQGSYAGYDREHPVWAELQRLWTSLEAEHAVPCLDFYWEDYGVAICKRHLAEILASMD